MNDPNKTVKRTVITARQFIDDNYADKITNGECIITIFHSMTNIGSTNEIVDINESNWSVVFADDKFPKNTFLTFPEDNLVVHWKIQVLLWNSKKYLNL